MAERSAPMAGAVRPGPGERLLLALLAASLLGFWALQYQPFQLPNNDYASFERAARSLSAAELPRSYQRMPVFPAAMALLAPALPDPHPYLHAALLLNLAFALGTLLLLHRLATPLLGTGALLVPLAFASATQLHAAALQPLVEPSLCFFVVLAFVLFQARSPWQWAAAFAAALSRYEAALLIPVLFLAELVFHEGERRFWRQAALAAAASSGILVWGGLGAVHGSGGSTYLDLMSGMGFAPALDFLERTWKEPFRGWYRAPFGPGFWIFLALVGGGVGLGLAEGWRRFRRETCALAGFWLVSTAAIVVFGINKARYVYPTEWIPLLFFVAGWLRAVELGGRRLASSGEVATRLAAGSGVALFGLSLLRWWPRLSGEAAPTPLALDVGFGLLLLAIAAAWVATQPRSGSWRAAAVLGLFVFVPLAGGGLQAKRAELWKIHYANHGSVVAARWLEAKLAPGERALVLPVSHVLFLTDLDPDQLLFYGQLEAASLDELRAEMRARGATHAVYTWRKPLQTPSDEFYDRRLKAFLSREFQSGSPIEGFRHVATLPLPEALGRDPVQVYRLVGDSG